MSDLSGALGDIGQRDGRDGVFHPLILGLSTAFWDASLRGDEDAKAWLNGKGAVQSLAEEDVWEMNAVANE